MHVASTLGSVAVLQEIEEPTRDGGEQLAYGTPKPLGERRDRNTLGNRAILIQTRWRAELCYLVAKPMADRT
jgi:hypothetical protein